jgi:hypothetical protein
MTSKMCVICGEADSAENPLIQKGLAFGHPSCFGSPAPQVKDETPRYLKNTHVEKRTLENITQRDVDLFNAFLLGICPTFKRTKSEQAAAATDAFHDIAWELINRKPRAEWLESDSDFIAQLYRNFGDGMTGGRIFLNEISAVTDTRRRNGSTPAIGDLSSKQSTARQRAFAEREKLENEPIKKPGAPRLSPEEKIARDMFKMNMPLESVRMILQAQKAGLGITDARIEAVLVAATK